MDCKNVPGRKTKRSIQYNRILQSYNILYETQNDASRNQVRTSVSSVHQFKTQYIRSLNTMLSERNPAFNHQIDMCVQIGL